MIRPMRRHAQQLDRATCEKVLNEAPRGVLAVLGDEGYPYAVPLNYTYVPAAEGEPGWGKIYFHGATAGHKLDAIAAYDKVSFCVLDEGVQEPGDWWYHFNSVIAFGHIRRITNETEMLSCLRNLGDKYFPSKEYTEKEIARDFARVAILELTIDHLTGKHVREK